MASPLWRIGAPADDGEVTALDAVLAGRQYIGTDTRYILRLPDDIDVVARVQNINEADSRGFSIGQPVTIRWRHTSSTVLDR